MQCRTLVLASIAFALSILEAADASALAQRTFVASYGNDANTCSLVMPCRTFGAAIVQSLSGGEVIVLDSAGYGPVTITQSVSIIAPSGIYAGISVPPIGNGAGITVDGAGINVVLRGLTIKNGGANLFGIVMTNGSELTIEDCEVSHFNTALKIWTSAVANISRLVAFDNDVGVNVEYGSTANIVNSQILTSGSYGILISGGLGYTTNVAIDGTLVTGSASASTLCIYSANYGAFGNFSITRATVTGCGTAIGILYAGTISVSNSMVTGNNTAFAQSAPGTFYSLGNNHVSGNTNDATGTITVIGGK